LGQLKELSDPPEPPQQQKGARSREVGLGLQPVLGEPVQNSVHHGVANRPTMATTISVEKSAWKLEKIFSALLEFLSV
jgi:hypothetical protein